MTDKRKDNLPLVQEINDLLRICETDNDLVRSIVDVLKERGLCPSPPVPDDVAEVKSRVMKSMCSTMNCSTGEERQEARISVDDFAILIRAASTPSAVSIVRSIKSLTLGDKYIGKITEQEAVDLVNAVIQSQIDMAGVADSTSSAEVQALRDIEDAARVFCQVISNADFDATERQIGYEVLKSALDAYEKPNQPHTGGK